MHKTFLIARREYLAFVRTVGFWLSLFTLPLIISCSIFIPVMIRTSAPAETVAVLDLSGDNIDGALRDIIRAQEPKVPAAGAPSGVAGNVLRGMGGGGLHLVGLPAGLSPDMTVEQAEAKIPALLRGSDKVSTILVAYDRDDMLHFHIWSDGGHKGNLEGKILWDLHGLQYYKLAHMHGIDAKLAHDMRESRADIVSMTPASAAGPKKNAIVQAFSDNGPRVLGAVTGYITWMAIFSSSMILLGSVIEEKSSKVLEVLLASASTESILVGKVLGVAAVMLTVAAIWATVIFCLWSYGAPYIPANVAQGIHTALSGLFSPVHVALLAVYFVTGYLMFGVMFAAIGAFCETQKDAQAVMGPTMIVLMIPMMMMQAAFVPVEPPMLKYLSYVPLFTPFLMPLRLSHDLPWWEIGGTLAGMGLMALLMVNIGRSAFRHGALSGAKLSWGVLLGFGRRDI